MKRPRSAGHAGFLLAETMITFALSALVLVGLVSAVAVLLRATDRSVAIVGSVDELGRTLAALNRDISGLKRARWNGEEPQPFVFRGGPNSLSFAQEMPAFDGGRELRVISLREIEKGRGTALMRSEARLPPSTGDWAALRFGAQSVVPTGPARLRFRYLAEAMPDEPPPRPIDSWPSGVTLPAAVIVEVVDTASTRLILVDRIAIQSDGDIGCADRSRSASIGPARQSQEAQPRQTSQPGQTLQPGQVSVAGGTPVTPFSLMTQSTAANNNEFCGRADKGLAPKSPASAALPLAGIVR